MNFFLMVMTKHIIFVDLFYSYAGNSIICNFSKLHVIDMNSQTIWITISEMLRKNRKFA